MLKAIVFDFGDIFINLDKSGALDHALELFKIGSMDNEMLTLNATYEKGLVSTKDFIAYYKLTNHTSIQLDRWAFLK